MSSQYLGELRLVSFAFAPKQWAMCNGQLLAIQSNAALFALLGTFYGGNGVSTFQLPNLEGRTPVSMGNGFTIGQLGGTETHTLTTAEVPTHTHLVNAISSPSNSASDSPGGNFLASASAAVFAASSTATGALNANSVSTVVGGNQPHENRQPYLVMNWIIALAGIFPTRS